MPASGGWKPAKRALRRGRRIERFALEAFEFRFERVVRLERFFPDLNFHHRRSQPPCKPIEHWPMRRVRVERIQAVERARKPPCAELFRSLAIFKTAAGNGALAGKFSDCGAGACSSRSSNGFNLSAEIWTTVLRSSAPVAAALALLSPDVFERHKTSVALSPSA